MCRTMMRFAEHYESPQYRGKYFSREEFVEWYRDGGEFTYYTDWNGFNVPGYIFSPFQSGKFLKLTAEERNVLKILPKGDVYVIATTEDYSALRHELGHALFYIDKTYQATVKDVLEPLPNKRVPMESIKSMGYHQNVLLDELHACLIDGIRYFDDLVLLRRSLGWRVWFKYWLASRKLNKLLDKTLVKHNAKL